MKPNTWSRPSVAFLLRRSRPARSGSRLLPASCRLQPVSTGRPARHGARLWLLAALALSAVPARAAVVATLPKAGEYTAWVEGPKSAIAAGPQTVTDAAKVVLDTGSETNTGNWTLVVDDASGNAAVLPIPSGESPRLALKSDDFNRIGRVDVTVTDKEGKAPTYAAVTLTDGKGAKQTVTLIPADGGRAVFRNVASGDGSVRVQQDAPTNQQTVTVRLPLQRDTPTLSLTTDVQLPEGMKTGSEAAAAGTPAASNAGTSKAAPAARSTLQSLGGFLVALIVLAIATVVILRELRNRGLTAESALARAGIRLPDEEPEATTVAAEAPQMVDPTICPFCGAKKDATGACPNCAVTPGASGGAAAFVGSAPHSGGGRRLVAVSGPRAGSIFPLSGTISLGRETGKDIAIPEDPMISRHHAVIEAANGGAAIVDQGSSNGTYVNGQRVERRDLRPGDEIAVGASRFRYEE